MKSNAVVPGTSYEAGGLGKFKTQAETYSAVINFTFAARRHEYTNYFLLIQKTTSPER